MSLGLVWTGITSGLITASATLLGVWLTQRHAWRMRPLDRHEERRVEQRDALAEVQLTGCELKSSLHRQLIEPFVCVGSDRPDVPETALRDKCEAPIVTAKGSLAGRRRCED